MRHSYLRMSSVVSATGIVGAALALGASPASANSIPPTIKGEHGTFSISYNDGTDTFCFRANPGYSVQATIAPDVASRGTVKEVFVADNTVSCLSLANYYEDSKATWTVWAGITNTDITVDMQSESFFT